MTTVRVLAGGGARMRARPGYICSTLTIPTPRSNTSGPSLVEGAAGDVPKIPSGQRDLQQVRVGQLSPAMEDLQLGDAPHTRRDQRSGGGAR
jgi:hypothetical protein